MPYIYRERENCCHKTLIHSLPVWMYRPLRLEDVGDVNSSLCVDEFQPAGRGVLDPGAVPVSVCARVRPCASGRDTRVVLLSGGTDGTLGGGGRRERDEEVFLATWLDTTRWRVRVVGPTTGEGHEGSPLAVKTSTRARSALTPFTRHVWRIRRNWYIRVKWWGRNETLQRNLPLMLLRTRAVQHISSIGLSIKCDLFHHITHQCVDTPFKS